jgi:hypothetical protein
MAAMSVHWLNSIARTPRGAPTFEDATVVVAAVATAAASIIAAPGLGGVAGARLACLKVRSPPSMPVASSFPTSSAPRLWRSGSPTRQSGSPMP